MRFPCMRLTKRSAVQVQVANCARSLCTRSLPTEHQLRIILCSLIEPGGEDTLTLTALYIESKL